MTTHQQLKKAFLEYNLELRTKKYSDFDRDNYIHCFRATTICPAIFQAMKFAANEVKILNQSNVEPNIITGAGAGGWHVPGEGVVEVRYEWRFEYEAARNLYFIKYYLSTPEVCNIPSPEEYYDWVKYPEKFIYDIVLIVVEGDKYGISWCHKDVVAKEHWHEYWIEERQKYSNIMPKEKKSIIDLFTEANNTKKIDCVICLEECDAKNGWECKTCKGGKICKGCKKKFGSITECPVCRTPPQHNKKKKN